jgi:hypothetical protein
MYITTHAKSNKRLISKEEIIGGIAAIGLAVNYAPTEISNALRKPRDCEKLTPIEQIKPEIKNSRIIVCEDGINLVDKKVVDETLSAIAKNRKDSYRTHLISIPLLITLLGV